METFHCWLIESARFSCTIMDAPDIWNRIGSPAAVMVVYQYKIRTFGFEIPKKITKYPGQPSKLHGFLNGLLIGIVPFRRYLI